MSYPSALLVVRICGDQGLGGPWHWLILATSSCRSGWACLGLCSFRVQYVLAEPTQGSSPGPRFRVAAALQGTVYLCCRLELFSDRICRVTRFRLVAVSAG